MASSSGRGAYAPASFSVHMTSPMLLNMLAPLLLMLGAPVTVALRALKPARPGWPQRVDPGGRVPVLLDHHRV